MGLKENLKMLRKAKGLKQSDVAEILGKKTLTIGRYETGVISPPIPVLEKLSEFYGLHTDFLVSDLPYVKGKKYSLQEIYELAIETLARAFADEFFKTEKKNNDEQIPLNFNIKDNESDKLFLKIFSDLNDVFVKNIYNLSDVERKEILKSLSDFLEFSISKRK